MSMPIELSDIPPIAFDSVVMPSPAQLFISAMQSECKEHISLPNAVDRLGNGYHYASESLTIYHQVRFGYAVRSQTKPKCASGTQLSKQNV